MSEQSRSHRRFGEGKRGYEPFAFTPPNLYQVYPCGCEVTEGKTVMCEEHYDQMMDRLDETD